MAGLNDSRNHLGSEERASARAIPPLFGSLCLRSGVLFCCTLLHSLFLPAHASGSDSAGLCGPSDRAGTAPRRLREDGPRRLQRSPPASTRLSCRSCACGARQVAPLRRLNTQRGRALVLLCVTPLRAILDLPGRDPRARPRPSDLSARSASLRGVWASDRSVARVWIILRDGDPYRTEPSAADDRPDSRSRTR